MVVNAVGRELEEVLRFRNPQSEIRHCFPQSETSILIRISIVF
jgi:hypothetical protein